jgi:hypothetical protein
MVEILLKKNRGYSGKNPGQPLFFDRLFYSDIHAYDADTKKNENHPNKLTPHALRLMPTFTPVG